MNNYLPTLTDTIDTIHYLNMSKPSKLMSHRALYNTPNTCLKTLTLVRNENTFEVRRALYTFRPRTNPSNRNLFSSSSSTNYIA